VAIDADVLRRLYVDERLSTFQIGARLGCAEATVLRRLRRFGIVVRARGPMPRRYHDSSPICWSPDLAYAVGLIATDGNLSPDGRHLGIPSKDCDLLESLRRCLRLTNRITRSQNGHIYRLQWGDRGFYDWLLSIGLTPAKSLTLGPLAVPEEHFADFFRGCLDGDGSVLVYTDRYHLAKNERYIYQRLYVSLCSASRPFLEWIQATIRSLVGIDGVINVKKKQDYHPVWTLRYAKGESIELLRWTYYLPTVPSLARKRATAEPFLRPLGHAPARPVGRPRAGWVYNQPSPDAS
jgi:hypothetical protein